MCLFMWLIMGLLAAGCDVSGIPRSAEPTPAIAPTTSPYPQTSTEAPRPEPTITSEAAPDTTPTLIPVSGRVALFSQVWHAVEQNYVYPDYHGADWLALRNEYIPKVAAATSADEFYNLVDEMVGKLKDDHSHYLSPWAAREEDRRSQGQDKYAGIGVFSKYLEDSFLVLEVFAGSPAEEAGLKRGDHITAVNGQLVKGTAQENIPIRGPEGTTVRLTVTSSNGPARDIAVRRRTLTATVSPTSSRLEADPSIGYLLIPTLEVASMSDQVESELQKLIDKGNLKGLVIDLRSNGGGLDTVLIGILGQFVSGQVGGFYSQDKINPLTIEKRSLYNALKTLTLVLLVDKSTASFAEVFAASLQARGRAKVVGVQTAGNTEEIEAYDFSDGSRLWLARYGFRLLDGTSLEGRGVTPDAVVDTDWTAHTLRDDPQVLKAIELIK